MSIVLINSGIFKYSKYVLAKREIMHFNKAVLF